MFIYCEYTSIVAELITVQINCTELEMLSWYFINIYHPMGLGRAAVA
jgi:hypothetical protein